MRWKQDERGAPGAQSGSRIYQFGGGAHGI